MIKQRLVIAMKKFQLQTCKPMTYKIKSLCCLLLFWLFSSVFCIAVADDAEIFYQAGAADVSPNVLFIMDSSSSMNQAVSGSGGMSRLAVMEEMLREGMEA